jgi:hypothetical protein
MQKRMHKRRHTESSVDRCGASLSGHSEAHERPSIFLAGIHSIAQVIRLLTNFVKPPTQDL